MDKTNKFNNDKKIYYFAYRMMELTFGNENIYDGLRRALYFAKVFSQASDAILYREKIDGSFDVASFNSYSQGTDFSDITYVLNQIKDKPYFNKPFNFNVEMNNGINSVLYYPFSFNKSRYVVVFTNFIVDENNNYAKFFEVLGRTIGMTIEKIKQYEMMIQDINMDALTGINNRNSYENDIRFLEENKIPYTYALLDLFRLKYINDNYSHYVGDIYIIKAAAIIQKYFPQYQTIIDQNGNEIKEETGSNVYRIGGDEFALIDQKNNVVDIEEKINKIQEEVQNIDLGIPDKADIGINYGIAYNDTTKDIKDVLFQADTLLRDDKTKMYQKLGIERRKS